MLLKPWVILNENERSKSGEDRKMEGRPRPHQATHALAGSYPLNHRAHAYTFETESPATGIGLVGPVDTVEM